MQGWVYEQLGWPSRIRVVGKPLSSIYHNDYEYTCEITDMMGTVRKVRHRKAFLFGLIYNVKILDSGWRIELTCND